MRVSRFIFALALLYAAPALADTRYFTQIEDLPIAPGLEETETRFEFFDTGASILGATARGSAQAERVRTYYQTALPELGWALSVGSGGENETVYLRGREELALSFHQRGDVLELQVLLFSQAPPQD